MTATVEKKKEYTEQQLNKAEALAKVLSGIPDEKERNFVTALTSAFADGLMAGRGTQNAQNR